MMWEMVGMKTGLLIMLWVICDVLLTSIAAYLTYITFF